MYGREPRAHSYPPMILPSQRGTAAVTHTHTQATNLSATATFHHIEIAATVQMFGCMLWKLGAHTVTSSVLCLFVSLPAAPTISSRASSLIVSAKMIRRRPLLPGLTFISHQPRCTQPSSTPPLSRLSVDPILCTCSVVPSCTERPTCSLITPLLLCLPTSAPSWHSSCGYVICVPRFPMWTKVSTHFTPV